MHIRRLAVHRYGPLEPFDETLFAFTVIHGPNEKGKTLLIDALVRMLFKGDLKRGQYRLFGNLSRVDERPEGFVVVATHADEVKLGAEDTLASVSPIAITPEDFRNVFLIRDSDLALKNEEAYYSRVSERLCGTRSGTIDRLKDALKRIGRLRSATPDSVLTIRKDKDQKRVGEQLVAAERLLDTMIALRESLEKSGFDAAYRRVADLADERAHLEQEARQRRDADDRARLSKAGDAVRDVRAREATLTSLAPADDARVDAWRAIVAERGVIDRDLADLSSRLADVTAARDQANAAWEAARTKAADADGRRARVRADLQPPLEAWIRDRRTRDHADRGARAVLAAMVVSIALGVAASVATVLTRSPFAVGAVVAFAMVAAGCGVVVWRGGRERASLARAESNLVALASRSGVAVASAGDIADAIATVEREADQAQEGAREADAIRRRKDADFEACETGIAERREKLAELDGREAALRRETGFESIDALAAAAAARRATETEIAERLAALRTLVPAALSHADRGQMLDACERYIAQRLSAVDDGGPAESDPDATRRAERELARVVKEEREQHSLLEASRDELRRIEMKVSGLGILDGPARYRTTRELAAGCRAVAEFCEGIRREQRLAQEAIRILNDIEIEEREKVGELFGTGTLVSRWFHDITAGRYRAVYLNDGEVEVEQVDGKRLSASALSGGTFDQLYLAIRASIAERMLPDSRGFFILDDPFLKADRDRMRALMKMLRLLVGRGWQVIYVTAKDDVVEALRPDIAASQVRLIELDRSLFSRSPRATDTPAEGPRLF